MLSNKTIEAGKKFVSEVEIADERIREAYKHFHNGIEALSGRRENQEFDYSKLNEGDNERS